MKIIASIIQTLDELGTILAQLTDNQYAAPCAALSGASIGQHTRHIIELFQCLLVRYDEGQIDYEKRARNKQIEREISYAMTCIAEIQQQIHRPNKELQLTHTIEGEATTLLTNYHRELLYNLEHCIHHQALIKVGLLTVSFIEIPPNFGVAASTIAYRKQKELTLTP